MSGFVINHYNLIDRSRVSELGPLAPPVAEKYGAEIIISGPVKALAGETYSQLVIHQFDSFEAESEFHQSPEMAETAELRNQIIEGFEAVVPGPSETENVFESGCFD